MNKFKRSIAAGALVMAAALSGCASNPSTLATVNGKTISAKEVKSVTKALRENPPSDVMFNDAETVAAQWTILAEAMPQIFKNIGVEYDAKKIDDQLAEARKQAPTKSAVHALLTDPRATNILRANVAVSLLQQEAAPEKFLEALNQIDVKLNPRFGTWDAGKPLTSASLSSLYKTAAQLKAEQQMQAQQGAMPAPGQ